MMSDKNKRVRFTYDDDLALLREVVSNNPLENPEKWELLQKNLENITRKKFLIRTLKDHVQLLLEIWLKKDKKDKIRSGVEEVYSEKDQLLQEISDVCSEFNIGVKRKRESISKEKKIVEMGRKARELYAVQYSYTPKNPDNCEHLQTPILKDHDYGEVPTTSFCNIPFEIVEENQPIVQDISIPSTSTITENPTPIDIQKQEIEPSSKTKPPTPVARKILEPTRKRLNKSACLRKTAMEYLNDKEDRESRLKKKELEFEERKINLEERKINMQEQSLQIEIMERKERLEMERDRINIELTERRQSIKLIESQQAMIEHLVQRLKKYEHC